MTIGRETELSDIVGYLLIRKLLQLLLNLKELMETKDAKHANLQYWEQFQGEKDFVDIKMYVWKEYDVFKVYYKTFDDRIREKTKMLNTELQEVVNNPSSPLNEKVYQRYLREYVRTLFSGAKKISFEDEKSERKFYAHHLRIMDSLNLEDVFYF